MAESRTVAAEFAGRVNDREATVAIVGLGYVGLPLAIAFAGSGLRTIGLDVDEARVAALRAGSSHIDDVPDTMLAAAEQFEATTDPDALSKADAIFLCVPTPFDATKTPVLDAAWPVETILACGVPTFDAVNALDVPTAGTHERL